MLFQLLWYFTKPKVSNKKQNRKSRIPQKKVSRYTLHGYLNLIIINWLVISIWEKLEFLVIHWVHLLSAINTLIEAAIISNAWIFFGYYILDRLKKVPLVLNAKTKYKCIRLIKFDNCFVSLVSIVSSYLFISVN